ncbi:MAG: DUF362 domain-containing protein [Armatimonadota bacterium]|nr:DUF362 domain-containing protein [Armatimonadota bacterium]
MPQSRVFAQRISSESSAEQVADGMAQLLDRFDLPRLFGGKTVLVKPNLCGESGPANTDPRVVYGVVRALQPIASRIIVGDGAVIGTETTTVINDSGLRETLRGTRAEVVDFKSGRYVEIHLANGRCTKKMMIAEAAVNADAIVSVAKLKTHDATGVSLAMKNLKGLLHEYDMLHFHHVNLSECIVDLVSAFRPALSVIDGLIALDAFGAGAVEMNVVLAGEDPVAVDATASRAIGVDPVNIYSGTLNESHIKRANERGLGEITNIEVIGDLPQAHFQSPPTSLSQIQTPEGMEIIDGDPCPACIGMLASVLQKLKQGSKQSENTMILVGPKAPPPEKTKGRTIIIGNCLHRLQSESEGSAFVIGCPPNATYDVLPTLEA